MNWNEARSAAVKLIAETWEHPGLYRETDGVIAVRFEDAVRGSKTRRNRWQVFVEMEPGTDSVDPDWDFTVYSGEAAVNAAALIHAQRPAAPKLDEFTPHGMEWLKPQPGDPS